MRLNRPTSKILTTRPTPPPSAATSVARRSATPGPTLGSSAGPPTTMRELLGRTYMSRGKTTWKHGASDVLGLAARDDVDGIDVRNVPEFTAVMPSPTSTTVGAFAPLAAFSGVLASGGSDSLAIIRLRLSLVGARLTVVREGVTTSIALEAFRPEPSIVPVSIEIPALAGGIGIAERRRATIDGAASYELSVVTALRISQLHRFEDVRIMVALDGIVQRASDAEALLDRKRFGLSELTEAARVSAHAIASVDARTSAAARAVAPLVLAALREAVAIAKPKDEEPRRRARPLTKTRKKK